MSVFDLDAVKNVLAGNENARQILTRSEKKTILDINIWLDSKTLIVADAFVVYHNTARGPAKGGIRIDANVSLEETTDLAERMTFKTALTGIPFGGGKSGIRFDSHKLDTYMKRHLIQEFVHTMRADLVSGVYIPAPDMGTTPKEMAVIYGELHIPECVTGKPLGVGGLPGRKEATGRGVAYSTAAAAGKCMKADIKGLECAVQGFGNVGSWTCFFLQKMGAKVTAVSDLSGGIFNKNGIDIQALSEHVQKTGCFDGFAGDKITNEELLSLNCDVLLPAAREDVLSDGNASKVRAKMVVEAANGPTTKDADKILHEKGVIVIPDILANSGGVIASYIEWRSAKSGVLTSADEVFEFIDSTIGRSFDKILSLVKDRKMTHKDAALTLATEEVVSAMESRGWI